MTMYRDRRGFYSVERLQALESRRVERERRRALARLG
jgi:hypothetical protein